MILQKYYKNCLLLLMMLAFACPSLELMADQEQEITLQETEQVTQNDVLQNEPEEPLWKKARHWVIATGAVLYNGIHCARREINPDLMAHEMFGAQNTLTPEIREIAHQVINQHGINPENITLLNASTNNVGIAVGGNTMVLDGEKFKEYTPEEIQFVIGHELSHLKNRDVLKMAVVAFASPFIAHFGLKAWDAGIHKLLSGIKSTFWIKKDSHADQVLSKIDDINHWLSTFCFTKAIVATQLFLAYSRYLEKHADIVAVTHLQSSEGAERFFKRAQEENKKFFSNGENPFDSAHPLLSERINYSRKYAQAYSKAEPVIIEAPIVAPVEVTPEIPVLVPTN